MYAGVHLTFTAGSLFVPAMRRHGYHPRGTQLLCHLLLAAGAVVIATTLPAADAAITSEAANRRAQQVLTMFDGLDQVPLSAHLPSICTLSTQHHLPAGI